MIKQYLIFVCSTITLYSVCLHAMEESEDTSFAHVLSTAFNNAVFGNTCTDMFDIELSDEFTCAPSDYDNDELGSIEVSNALSYESEDISESVDSECNDELDDLWICENIEQLRAKRDTVEGALEFNYTNNRVMRDVVEQYVAQTHQDESVSYERVWFEIELRIAFTQITNKPKRILRYCYYQQYHKEQEGNILNHLSTFPELFNSCKKRHVAGCSAIGAALLAPRVSPERKRKFLGQLYSYGFVPTDNDYKLATIVDYDAIPDLHKEKIVWLLHKPNEDGWCMFMLPKDIRKHMVNYMIFLLRKEYGFL